ncbi:MAG: hypothetical protein WBB12_18110 [Saprospiraceae bacterium]|nr:hypothetical protein [Saprospiraceae bacterium]MBK9677862.1 hypothetical protein [Saprospiraceae bacterium]
MKTFKTLFYIIIISLVMATGCTDDSLVDLGSQTLESRSKSSALKTISPEVKAKLAALRAKIPAGSEARLQHNSTLLKDDHSEYRAMILRAMNGVTPSPCDASSTALNVWLGQQLEGWDEVLDGNGNTVFDYANLIGMLDFPTYDALLFENSSTNQYFGVNGAYSQKTTKAFKDLKRFWNIQSDGIVLAAMHGSMLRDREKVIRIDRILFGDSQAAAEFYADLTLFLLENIPQYRNGDHPIFTFNAFAQSSFNFGGNVIPSKIIMGDGIVDAYVGIGYGDVASQAILSHEYGHHIQFQLGLFNSPITDPAEATRRTELMADAFSAYYLSHARGASMQWKRVQLFLQVFFNIGDCAFNSGGHHGTPLQRMAAANWGYSVANDAQKQGHILTAEVFSSLFDAQLPLLL